MAKFRLQTALDVRQRLERLKQKDFSQEIQAEQKIQNEIMTIQQQLQNNNQQANQLRVQGFGIAQLQFHAMFQTRLEAKLKILQQQLQEQKQQTERTQKLLIEATQKRRVLEILKEKEEEREAQKQRKQEQAAMDEIAQVQRSLF